MTWAQIYHKVDLVDLTLCRTRFDEAWLIENVKISKISRFWGFFVGNARLGVWGGHIVIDKSGAWNVDNVTGFNNLVKIPLLQTANTLLKMVLWHPSDLVLQLPDNYMNAEKISYFNYIVSHLLCQQMYFCEIVASLPWRLVVFSWQVKLNMLAMIRCWKPCNSLHFWQKIGAKNGSNMK